MIKITKSEEKILNEFEDKFQYIYRYPAWKNLLKSFLLSSLRQQREEILEEFNICEDCAKNKDHNWNFCSCHCNTCPTGIRNQKEAIKKLQEK